jgi:histidinol-phosphatase
MAHHLRWRHDCRALQLQHRFRAVPAAFHRLGGVDVHILLRPDAHAEEPRVIAAALTRRCDEVRDVDQLVWRDGQAVLGERIAEVPSTQDLLACRSDSHLKIVVTGVCRCTADEEADLLEHLANARDPVCLGQSPVRGVDGTPGEDKSVRCETAAARPAEHADLDAAVDIAQQRDGARGDRFGDHGTGHRSHGMERHNAFGMKSHLDVALELADIADAITLARFRAPDLRVDTKSDNTPVTDADRATEEALREALGRLRPAQQIVGEEYGGDDGAEWRWMLDPIDGTLNYANGVPVWATLIALMRGERAVCGVVSAAALGRRWWAATGQGAFTESGRMHVSRTAALAEAYVSCTDVRDFAARGGEAGFREVLRRARVVRAFGDFWSHMLVAEGVIDVAVEAWVNPWDVAAAQVIIAEAGGRFSDFAGADRIDSGNVISTNGLLHDDMVGLMSSSGR